MQSVPSDFVSSDNQLGGWGSYSYGYSDIPMAGSDWFTSLPTDLEGSPLAYDSDMQHKETYPMQFPGAASHRTSPLDSPIEVAEADSTQHQHSYPVHQHYHHGTQGDTADFIYQNQKHTHLNKMPTTNGGTRFVPHGYYNSGGRGLSTSATPNLMQPNVYPSPPAQMFKHTEAAPYSKPYGLLYVNGDHVPQPMAYSDSSAPFGAHAPGELYQPYANVATPTYEGNLPSFQSVLQTGIDSMLPVAKYEWGSSTGSPVSSERNHTSPSNAPCYPVKEEYMMAYQSPSPLSLAGGSSIKTELMSDGSQTPPPLAAPTVHVANVRPMETPSPQNLPPLESKFNGAINESTTKHQEDILSAACSVIPLGPALLKKHARITNNYGTLFSCQDCERTFARQCGLTQHMKWHHSGDKPFRCTICGKCFSAEEALRLHVERHSAVDKPHRCHVCPKAFFHKNDLRRHVYQHTGTAPHNCKYCGKAFARKDHCHSHEFSHERKVERQEKKSKRTELAKILPAPVSTSTHVLSAATIVPGT